MVQVKSAAVALIFVAPSLALPVQKLNARSEDLEAREPIPEPKFRIRNIVNTAKRIAHNPGVRQAASFASQYIREDGDELEARDLDDIELDAREPIPEPKFRIKNLVHTVQHIAHNPVVRKAASIAKMFFREEGDELEARDFDDIELEAREPEPKFRIGNVIHTAQRIAHNPGVRKAVSIARMFIRDVDGSPLLELDARELGDVVEAMQNISERELDEMEELAEREPKLKFLKKIRGIAGRVGRLAGPVMNAASAFVREEDGELYAREDLMNILDFTERDLEAMEELAARDPKWGFLKKIKGFVNKASKFVKPAMRVAGMFIREEDADIYDLLAREYDDFDLLD